MTPRPREFSTEEALDRAMHVFWENGYEGASLQELIGAMGISKSSFYETFGSKHDLFLSALEHYSETVVCEVVRHLDEVPSGREAIGRHFRLVVDVMTGAERHGCLLCNCAVERAPTDPEAALRVRSGLKRMEEAFFRAVVRAQQAEEMSREADPRALARYLLACSNGLLVVAKAHPSETALSSVVEMVMKSLR